MTTMNDIPLGAKRKATFQLMNWVKNGHTSTDDLRRLWATCEGLPDLKFFHPVLSGLFTENSLCGHWAPGADGQKVKHFFLTFKGERELAAVHTY